MSDLSKKFKVGDRVVRTGHTYLDSTVVTGEKYTVAKVDDKNNVIYLEGVFLIEGELDWFDPDSFELAKEDETMSEQTTEQTQNIVDVTPKTPYQEKGYTENSLFKFVGEDGEFEEGEILKLNYDDGTFTLSYISTTTSDVSYLYFNEVEYVGEEGSEDMLPDYEEVVKQPPNYEETVTTHPVKDVVTHDNVNHPNHYKTGKTECIVAMEEMLSTEEFIGYLRGNIYKYTYRYKDKNGVEDLKKAQWYLSKLIEKEAEKQALEKETNHG